MNDTQISIFNQHEEIAYQISQLKYHLQASRDSLNELAYHLQKSIYHTYLLVEDKSLINEVFHA